MSALDITDGMCTGMTWFLSVLPQSKAALGLAFHIVPALLVWWVLAKPLQMHLLLVSLFQNRCSHMQ